VILAGLAGLAEAIFDVLGVDFRADLDRENELEFFLDENSCTFVRFSILGRPKRTR
jgi:hypothetical protein